MKNNEKLILGCVLLVLIIVGVVVLSVFFVKEKFVSENNVTVKGGVTPVGSLLPYGGQSSDVPMGYLLCDGSSYPVASFPDLYSVIKNSYGGDSTNFNVPDLRARVPMGSGSTQYNRTKIDGTSEQISSATYTLGQRGGEETHILSVAEMPSHRHPGYVSTSGTGAAGGGSYLINYGSTDATGGSQPHNNIQPYVVVNYIIKY